MQASRSARPRVELENPGSARAAEFVAAALRSRALHRPFVAAPASPAEFDEYLLRCADPRFLSRFIVTAAARELVGVVEIRDRTAEPRPTGRLAYYAFVPHEGRGLVTEGVALAVAIAFGELGLEELTADIQASNRRSIAVVERLGFRRDAEVAARKVGRRWLEHERWRLARAARGGCG